MDDNEHKPGNLKNLDPDNLKKEVYEIKQVAAPIKTVNINGTKTVSLVLLNTVSSLPIYFVESPPKWKYTIHNNRK